MREALFPAALRASGGLLVSFGVPWLVDASHQSLPSSSRDGLCVCVSKFPFIRALVTSG